jgi:cytochrome subunit of sulfide dehydrogenase
VLRTGVEDHLCDPRNINGSVAPASHSHSRASQFRSVRVVSAILFAGLVMAAEVRADETLNGRRIAGTCANCHGTDGRSQGGMPALAGYPADRMVATMADFKSGNKPATIMHQIAKGYSDAQVAAVAAYFAALRN